MAPLFPPALEYPDVAHQIRSKGSCHDTYRHKVHLFWLPDLRLFRPLVAKVKSEEQWYVDICEGELGS